jgi:glycosyltransferase involved in cell wall biosynthesis
MRKLLICSRSHDPHGGADRIIADLCRELPRRDWQVTLGLAQGARFNDAERYRAALGADLPVLAIDGRLGTRRARVEALRRAIRAVEPDVVLSMRVFDAYEAVALEKRRSARGPRLAIGVRSFEPAYLADLALYRDWVDLCVTSGALLAALAIDPCGIGRERVESIGGGVRPPLAPPAARTGARPVRLVYVGRLDPEQKRVLDLVPFLDELDRRAVAYELDVAGEGPAEQELRSRLAPRVEAGQVRFHGWVDRERLYRTLYPRADCFVHFAAWEGMTIAPREAMAHGVVPVISRFRGQQLEGQFVDGRTALTFPVGDVPAAAAAVQRLVVDPGLLTQLSRAAMQSQTGRYSFDGSIDAWAAAFERCLELPVRLGRLPRVRDRNDGRLARWVVPAALQDRVRALLRRKVVHSSPGSEWPTSSGQLDDAGRRWWEQHASGAEAGAGPAS